MLQEEKKVQRKKIIVILILWMMCHLVYMAYWGTQKINYHVDEIFTYGLSNDPDAIMPAWPKWEEGKTYDPNIFLQESLSVSPEDRFDYKMVWENQKMDVHPPFYYMLIHTICSFFPGVFSKWQGLIVNFVMLLGIDFFLYLAAKAVFQKTGLAFLTVVVNGFTLLTVNMSLYLRMYSMMTACTVGIVALFLYYENKRLDGKFYGLLFLGAVTGAMTQYYFLIYLFFLCLFFGCSLLVQKRWKETSGYVLSLALAGGTCYLLFPAMIEQIFGNGERGQEAFQNAAMLSGVMDKIRNYFYILNREVFGEMGKLFLILMVFVLVYKLINGKIKEQGNRSMLFLFCSTVGYMTIISAIAPYIENRYIMATGPVWVLLMIWSVYNVISIVWKKRKEIVAFGMTTAVCICILVTAMYQTGWTPLYTYQTTKDRSVIAEKYRDCDVLYVFNSSWTSNDNLVELKKYKSCTFVTPKNLWEYLHNHSYDKLIVYNESQDTDEQIMDIMYRCETNMKKSEVLYQTRVESILYFE